MMMTFGTWSISGKITINGNVFSTLETMEQVRSGWFSEISDLWPGQCMSLKVEEVLYHERSEYQDIMVIKTKSHGTALILDGIIQCTEFDEFAYQEMIAFLPLNIHPTPTAVLIVGGGDGGVAREVAKHPLVRNIVQVEIDAKVVEASKKYLPFMASGFSSDKLTLKIGDGFQYMREHENEFDVIITDSSDPVGPAANLFTESYFQLLKRALKPKGVVCSQGGAAWVGLEHVQQTVNHCKKHFDVVKYAVASVPTYPCGQIGFVVGSLDGAAILEEPVRKFSGAELKGMHLRYYNDEVHRGSFVLPNFVKDKLG